MLVNEQLELVLHKEPFLSDESKWLDHLSQTSFQSIIVREEASLMDGFHNINPIVVLTKKGRFDATQGIITCKLVHICHIMHAILVLPVEWNGLQLLIAELFENLLVLSDNL